MSDHVRAVHDDVESLDAIQLLRSFFAMSILMFGLAATIAAPFFIIAVIIQYGLR